MSETDRHEPSANEVASFLRRNPKFLSEYPDLSLMLVVPREEGQATSLASYQLEVLRDKNRELNRRLHELYDNAQANERLAVRTHQLTLALMRARSAAQTLHAMVACLIEDFDSELVRIVLFEPVPGQPDTEWLRLLPEDRPELDPFQEFLRTGEPLCGRLQADKLHVLFGQRASEVASAALLPLPQRGMLAVGSHDANRFFPGMGTLFLRLMAESLDVALARYQED
ncbi:MAG TPA: DUF484 family protein [Xanthomonadaceae bacterium]|nr:DUF484 family protein [Xanthomonadaceae bacterium]